MVAENLDSFQIKRLEYKWEIESCARMMAGLEPWITLRRDYEASVATLSDPVKEIYLAVVQDEIVGFTIINMTGAFVGYIQTMCVAPAWRNQGIGSRLLGFVEKRILEDVPNIFICVSSFNPNAKRLYQRLGYEVIGELRDWIVSGHSEYLLRKTVSPLSEPKK
jgi:ribosomal-protein-alanine N-acetyltransferase